MKTIEELQKQYYEEFCGLPGNQPIVRSNQINDAFELVVLKVLYGKNLPDFNKSNASIFAEYIIAPPDNGIDIFMQHENADEYSFDVIQVKNSILDESQLRDCFLSMERTIDDYCKDPRKLKSERCKTILSNSNLEKSNKNKCTYYVVHAGTTDDFSGSEEYERVITLKSLNLIYNNISDCVDNDELHISSSVEYGSFNINNGAIVCSLNGYDLAELCNAYYRTEIGRNILFGSNLRDSLITKKSNTFKAMSKTITECPQNFWYFNNGITIIAKDIVKKGNDTVSLTCFSIVNGAQTTSSLGLFLREAKKNNDYVSINSLKNVFVLTRILKIPDEKMRKDIAIYNNTQNPITSRDMVSNSDEQKHLHEWLLDDTYPQIYCEIKRGFDLPSTFNRTFSHRITTNEQLAQFAYAAFLQRPFTAKDKRKALFSNDFSQNEYLINKIYHDIFNWDESNPENNGLIFKKTKQQIDEMLFVKQLYNEAKKVSKNSLCDKINNAMTQKENASSVEEAKDWEKRIATFNLHKDTIGICLFYFLALYYEFKAQFPTENKSFKFDEYYSDKSFRKGLIEDATNIFLNYTVKILIKTATDNGRSGNVNNWIRSAQCETEFLRLLRDELTNDYETEQKYRDFCDKYKA